MSDAPSAPPSDTPPTSGGLSAPTVIVKDTLPLFKNPRKGQGWVDTALDVISQMRAKSDNWDHGRANIDTLNDVIERRNAGSRKLGAHELEHIKLACEDAQKYLGLSDNPINPLAEIAKLFGMLSPSERAAVADALKK
jgi:hypothetical protein